MEMLTNKDLRKLILPLIVEQFYMQKHRKNQYNNVCFDWSECSECSGKFYRCTCPASGSRRCGISVPDFKSIICSIYYCFLFQKEKYSILSHERNFYMESRIAEKNYENCDTKQCGTWHEYGSGCAWISVCTALSFTKMDKV